MVTLVTGKAVNVLKFQEGDVDIRAIAHSLAHINRFNGHTDQPISVAHHSFCVANLVFHRNSRTVRQALLHDASEAYIGDVTKWFKMSPKMKGYRELENHIQRTIFRVFDCPGELLPEVEEADKLMVRWEARQGYGKRWTCPPGYPDVTEEERRRIGQWRFWTPNQARVSFLNMAERLGML